jgi:HSP20 family protein
MTTVTRRSGRVADVLNWLDESGFPRRGGFGLLRDLRVEDYVEDGTYVIRAEVPGIDPEKDLDVYVENGVLVVQGERREQEHDKNHQELHYGLFERALRLPEGVDRADVKATYEDGVLEVRVPFADDERAVPRHRIPVERSAK